MALYNVEKRNLMIGNKDAKSLDAKPTREAEKRRGWMVFDGFLPGPLSLRGSNCSTLNPWSFLTTDDSNLRLVPQHPPKIFRLGDAWQHVRMRLGLAGDVSRQPSLPSACWASGCPSVEKMSPRRSNPLSPFAHVSTCAVDSARCRARNAP